MDYVDVLRKVMQNVKSTHPFHIDAMVILPDHLHALWTLPVGDRDYPTRLLLTKASFSRQIPKGERRSDSRQAKGECGIWQRRYWEHGIKVARFDFFPNAFGSTCRVIKKTDWQTMTEYNLFYYPHASVTNAQLPLLKVAALSFGKLVIFDPVGTSWATIGADHCARDAVVQLKDADILQTVTPADVLE